MTGACGPNNLGGSAIASSASAYWLVVVIILPIPMGGLRLNLELAVESSDEGGDDLNFRDVGNRIPHLRKASDVATEELRWLLVDAVEIMLGAQPSTRSHIIVGEDFFSSSQDPMESGARLVNQFMAVDVSMMGR